MARLPWYREVAMEEQRNESYRGRNGPFLVGKKGAQSCIEEWECQKRSTGKPRKKGSSFKEEAKEATTSTFKNEDRVALIPNRRHARRRGRRSLPSNSYGVPPHDGRNSLSPAAAVFHSPPDNASTNEVSPPMPLQQYLSFLESRGFLPPQICSPPGGHSTEHAHLHSSTSERLEDHISLVSRDTLEGSRRTKTIEEKWRESNLSDCSDASRGIPLTKKQNGVYNNGRDNEDCIYICHQNDLVYDNEKKYCYQVLESLGEGSFAQVFKCRKLDVATFNPLGHYALKIVKNAPLYARQAESEIKILLLIRDVLDPYNVEGGIVRLHHHFVYCNHICLVFELLNDNMYEVLRNTNYEGLPLKIVQQIAAQLLDATALLSEANISHCDVKPENVLLDKIGYYPNRNSVSDLNEIGENEINTDMKGKQKARQMETGSSAIFTTQSVLEILRMSGHDATRGIWETSTATSPCGNETAEGSGNCEMNACVEPTELASPVLSFRDVLTSPKHLENILVKVKLIDFGSAHMMESPTFSYVQSRFYRAPEVILGHPCTSLVDMWSIGCLLYELYVGLPLFPGVSEEDQLNKIMDILGPPPSWMMQEGGYAARYKHLEGYAQSLQSEISSICAGSTMCESQLSEISAETEIEGQEGSYEESIGGGECKACREAYLDMRMNTECVVNGSGYKVNGKTDCVVDKSMARASLCKYCRIQEEEYSTNRSVSEWEGFHDRRDEACKDYSKIILDQLLSAKANGSTRDEGNDEKLLEDFSDLLVSLLRYDPSERMTANNSRHHAFVKIILSNKTKLKSEAPAFRWHLNHPIYNAIGPEASVNCLCDNMKDAKISNAPKVICRSTNAKDMNVSDSHSDMNQNGMLPPVVADASFYHVERRIATSDGNYLYNNSKRLNKVDGTVMNNTHDDQPPSATTLPARPHSKEQKLPPKRLPKNKVEIRDGIPPFPYEYSRYCRNATKKEQEKLGASRILESVGNECRGMTQRSPPHEETNHRRMNDCYGQQCNYPTNDSSQTVFPDCKASNMRRQLSGKSNRGNERAIKLKGKFLNEDAASSSHFYSADCSRSFDEVRNSAVCENQTGIADSLFDKDANRCAAPFKEGSVLRFPRRYGRNNTNRRLYQQRSGWAEDTIPAGVSRTNQDGSTET